LSLYDKDGLTVARLVLRDNGRYHLRTPITWPRMAWSDLDETKRRAESISLAPTPLASVDPKLAARIKRDNETAHPMGPPFNRPLDTGDSVLLGAGSKFAFKANGPWRDDLDVPAFLQRDRGPS